MDITICDSIMGSGKTSAAIRYIINHNHNKMKFIFITPYLKEVERIIGACNVNEVCYESEDNEDECWGEYPLDIKKQVEFYQPSNEKRSKLIELKSLLKKNSNIVTTHSLFNAFDSEVIDLVEQGEYTLFLDEVPTVIDLYNKRFKKNQITSYDVNLLLEKSITKDNTHILKWNDKNYKGRFEDIKKLCELEALGLYGDSTLIWMQPIKSFTCFKKIFVLTYMFDGQFLKYYFDMNNIKYDYCIATKSDNGKYKFEKVDKPSKSSIDKSLINIYNEVLNKIGDGQYNLSKSWYLNAKKADNLVEIKNNLYNYIHNIIKAKTNKIMWTCFEDFQSDLEGKGFIKSFVACNCMATNDYKERDTVCYMINLFTNPQIKEFIQAYGITINEDKYSLSSLLQFLFRSCLRENKPINLYIPSSRMRGLLEDWLKQ